MFCYQPEKPFGQTVMPGVYNSATELMTPELWRLLTTSPQTAWLVAKHREVKATLTDAKWASDADFLDFDRRMRRLKSGPAKAYQAFDSDEKRVAAWCDSLKRRLPFVIFVATYPERTVKEGSQPAMWRNQKFAQLNGLVVLDVDHIDDPVGVFHRITERLFRPPLTPPNSGGESTTLSSSPESGEVRRGLNEALQKDVQPDFRPPLTPPNLGGEVGCSSPESGEARRGLNEAPQKDNQRDFRPPLTPPDSGGEMIAS